MMMMTKKKKSRGGKELRNIFRRSLRLHNKDPIEGLLVVVLRRVAIPEEDQQLRMLLF